MYLYIDIYVIAGNPYSFMFLGTSKLFWSSWAQVNLYLNFMVIDKIDCFKNV